MRRGCPTSQGVIFTQDRNWMFTESCFICHEVWATWLTGQLTEDAPCDLDWSQRSLSSFSFGVDPQIAPLPESAAAELKGGERKLFYFGSFTVPRGVLVLWYHINDIKLGDNLCLYEISSTDNCNTVICGWINSTGLIDCRKTEKRKTEFPPKSNYTDSAAKYPVCMFMQHLSFWRG